MNRASISTYYSNIIQSLLTGYSKVIYKLFKSYLQVIYKLFNSINLKIKNYGQRKSRRNRRNSNCTKSKM